MTSNRSQDRSYRGSHAVIGTKRCSARDRGAVAVTGRSYPGGHSHPGWSGRASLRSDGCGARAPPRRVRTMLSQVIGDFLPSAVGVAISPIPIIAVILMLGTPKARTDGPAFAAGWVVGMIAVAVVVLLLTGSADTSSTANDGVNWLKVAIGILFLV